ncbi:hypothetical protein GQ42DRAFT_169454 [Ramicandelaber brevisporus]|nr:hypothetical protein GQ42DRAFT_169454 [Ramicandelaber brevisporus]
MKTLLVTSTALFALFHAVAHAEVKFGTRYVPFKKVNFEWRDDKFAVYKLSNNDKSNGLGLIFCKNLECKDNDGPKDGSPTKIATLDKDKNNKKWFKVNEEKGYIGYTDKFEDATEIKFETPKEENGALTFGLSSMTTDKKARCCYANKVTASANWFFDNDACNRKSVDWKFEENNYPQNFAIDGISDIVSGAFICRYPNSKDGSNNGVHTAAAY